MKRYITLLIIFSGLQLSAQIADDALISSRYIFNGTARTQAMGGAFTALGGDLTSATLNPAGLGLYRSNDFSLSLMGDINKVESNYLNTKNTNDHFRMIMPNIGFALSAPNLNKLSNGEGPNSWTFAIGYNQIHTFNKNMFIGGKNDQSSYLDMMLEYASEPMFDSVDLIFYENDQWTHDFLEYGYGANQEIYMTERGGIGEYYFSGAVNFDDKLFIGGTFGIQNYYLERTFEISETPTTNIPLKGYDYNYMLTTKGMGINAKIGVIYSPVYWSKIGFSVHTPTSFRLTDSEQKTLDATIEYIEGTFTNMYSSNPYYPDYKILTPLRINTGVSFLIMRQALLAVDYEFVDYGSAQLSSTDYNFNTENRDISNNFKGAHSVKIGAEYRLGMVALRAGGFYYGSPYAKETINKDASILGYTAGIGFKSGITYFDISFSNLIDDYKISPYGYENANIKNTNTKVAATLGFRF